MTGKVASSVRLLIITVLAGLVTACSVNETRPTGRLVITGSPERVDQFLASQTAGRTPLRTSISPPNGQGQVAATLAFPEGASDEVMRLMTGAIEAKLTVSYTATGATRTFRLG